jgi:hypothetical protein
MKTDKMRKTMVPMTFTTKTTAVGQHIDDKMPQCYNTKTKTRELKEICGT